MSALHHRDGLLDVRLALTTPRIARNPRVDFQSDALRLLPPPVLSPHHDQCHPTALLRGTRQRVQPFF